MGFELVPTEHVETRAEVVCVRREGAYIRLPDWCSHTLLLMEREDYPNAMYGSSPAAGVVYNVEADLTQDVPRYGAFRLRVRSEVHDFRPRPLPPPGGLPGPGESLPIQSENGLRRLIQSAIREKLSKESLDTLAYLVRRAHGLGTLGR